MTDGHPHHGQLTAEAALARFPTVAAVIGANHLRQRPEVWAAQMTQWVEWYDRMEVDLATLAAQVGFAQLIQCYRAQLRDPKQVETTLYEVHGAALLATHAGAVRLHVPLTGGGRNFDVQVEIHGVALNADSKTRRDEFPFNFPRRDTADLPGYFGSCATVDRHDRLHAEAGADRVPGEHHVATPESTVVRQLLLEGLAQLPEGGCNVILFGQIAGDRAHLERALYGMDVAFFDRNIETKEVTAGWARLPVGAYCPGEPGEKFEGLSAVLWMRLWSWGRPALERAYTLYPNPRARRPLPPEVQDAIKAIMREWATVQADEPAA